MSKLDKVAIVLLVIGGINWGLIGFLRIDAIALLVGDMTFIARVIYAIVGLAALKIIFHHRQKKVKVPAKASVKKAPKPLGVPKIKVPRV